MDENKIETLDQLVDVNVPGIDKEDSAPDQQDQRQEQSVQNDQSDQGASEPSNDAGAGDQNDEPGTQDVKEDLSKRLDDALNAITDGAEKKKEDEKQDANQQPTDGAKAQDAQKAEGDTNQKKEDNKPKTEAEEEAEILAMAGNERSRKRFEKLLHERKEAREIANSFVDQIKGAGYDVNSFATVLEFGRLVSSNDVNQKRQAMAMLDQVRANLAAELGEVDLLKGNPDLEKEVKDMNLDRKRAVEIANARRQKAAMEQQNHFAVERAQWQQKMQSAQTQMGQVLLSKQNEPFFNQKIQAIRTWLSTGNNMQNFVNSVPPEQWATQIEVLYNSLPAQFYQGANQPATAQAKPRQTQPQPLRSRSMNTGVLDTSKMNVNDFALEIMKDM